MIVLVSLHKKAPVGKVGESGVVECASKLSARGDDLYRRVVASVFIAVRRTSRSDVRFSPFICRGVGGCLF